MTTDEHLTASLDLLRRAQGGDASCLNALLERYQSRLLGRIRLMMGAPARRVAESADFLQGALIEVARDLDRFEIRSEAQLLRWMTEIARNNIRDALRKKREIAFAHFSGNLEVCPSVSPCTPSPSEVAVGNDEQHQLAEALERLRPEFREVLELRQFERLSHREIGENMGRSENAVQLLHSRALVRLGELLGG